MKRKGRVLLTGDHGYIGSVLSGVLQDSEYEVVGMDADFFAACNLELPNDSYEHLRKDIRDITVDDLATFDAVIHLAGLSNDPLGAFSPSLTDEINLAATVQLGRYARTAGVKRFVYASSQSMYGIAATDHELDEDNSLKHPLTAYARTKWQAEHGLKELNGPDYAVVCMRPSTVFGWSPRLRCDIVFNNLVASAYTTGEVEIKSDGTPWRPVIHVRDVCSAFMAGLEAPASLVAGRSYNVGIANGNYTVRDLADAAGRAVAGSRIKYTGEHGSDSRTYRVSFSRILSELKGWYRPEWSLDRGGDELVEKFANCGFEEAAFRGRQTIRLAQLKHLTESELINSSFRWTHAARG